MATKPGKGSTSDGSSAIDGVTSGAEMFANRLRKNQRVLGKWARQKGVDCYRLYDGDMPEYALAIDLYETGERWVHCQEYAAPRSVDPGRAAQRLQEAIGVIPQVLEVPAERVVLKVRQRQKGGTQYEKLGEQERFYAVREGPGRFLVNFTDYLDTGLFLDHRLTRALVFDLAAGRRFLNLFAYTGSVSVYAALGGAVSTTTVDMSATYLGWAERNFRINGLSGKEHRFVQADCVAWLAKAAAAPPAEGYGLIFLDPPTYSRSKRMSGNFDVQRDHVSLISRAMKLMSAEGVLVFSNNFRRFRLDPRVSELFSTEDITASTIPRDFERNPKIHRCWLIRKR